MFEYYYTYIIMGFMSLAIIVQMKKNSFLKKEVEEKTKSEYELQKALKDFGDIRREIEEVEKTYYSNMIANKINDMSNDLDPEIEKAKQQLKLISVLLRKVQEKLMYKLNLFEMI